MSLQNDIAHNLVMLSAASEEPRVLRDIGLKCPQCAYERMAATDSFCWRCGHVLGETWVHEQG